jgi:WD40 repeat protein
LEDGNTYNRVLFTHPQGKRFGNIVGEFPNITIPKKGGKLQIAGGYLQGAQESDGIKFLVFFIKPGEVAAKKVALREKRPRREAVEPDVRQDTGSPGNLLCFFEAKYDGKIDHLEKDLAQIAGQTGTFYLVVEAGSSSDYDWAVWTTARLIFGAKSKVQLLQTLRGHANRVYEATFSPNNQYVVTASGDSLAKVWEVRTGRLIQTFRGHSSHVFCARFSPNNRQVVTSGGNTAKLWEVASGAQVKMLIGHAQRVHSAEFSRDGAVIVTSSEDGTAKLWNAHSGKEIRTINVAKGWIYSAAFSPNSSQVATGAHNGRLDLWDVSNGRKIRSFSGHSRAVTAVCFSPDGRLLASSSVDNSAKIWQVSNAALKQNIRGNNMNDVGFSPDGKYLVTAQAGGMAKVWRTSDGKEVLTIQHSSPAYRVLSATFSPDGRYIVTGGEDHIAKIWRITLVAE